MTTNPRPIRCSECGGDAHDTLVDETVKIKHDGRMIELSIKGLEVSTCEKCGEVYYDYRADLQTQAALRAHLRFLLPAQVVALREKWGLRQIDVTADTGIAAETLSRIENGHAVQSKATDVILRVYFANPAVFRGTVKRDLFEYLSTSVLCIPAPIAAQVSYLPPREDDQEQCPGNYAIAA